MSSPASWTSRQEGKVSHQENGSIVLGTLENGFEQQFHLYRELSQLNERLLECARKGNSRRIIEIISQKSDKMKCIAEMQVQLAPAQRLWDDIRGRFTESEKAVLRQKVDRVKELVGGIVQQEKGVEMVLSRLSRPASTVQVQVWNAYSNARHADSRNAAPEQSRSAGAESIIA